ncbi:MAG: hypothetical protein GX335_07080 [Firmicutes bacterium]|nr:hypothetical protein [Bacillota bacterium]
MLEHVLSHYPGLKQIMNLFNPPAAALAGVNINRGTGGNLEGAGFQIREEDLRLDIFKQFEALPQEGESFDLL